MVKAALAPRGQYLKIRACFKHLFWICTRQWPLTERLQLQVNKPRVLYLYESREASTEHQRSFISKIFPTV